MADYKKNARSIVNSFLWNNLVNSEILLEDQYRPDGFTKSIVPIIPSQEVPELNNLLPEKEFIVYDYDVEGYGDQWWICEETMTYTIVGSKISKVVEISEFMVDLFRRVDVSGQDLQSFNTESQILTFYSVELNSVSGPTPVDMEGGRTAIMIEISYKYSRVVGDNGRFS